MLPRLVLEGCMDAGGIDVIVVAAHRVGVAAAVVEDFHLRRVLTFAVVGVVERHAVDRHADRAHWGGGDFVGENGMAGYLKRVILLADRIGIVGAGERPGLVVGDAVAG